MLRVVLDVNVLVSGFPARRGIPASILLAWSDGIFDMVVSEHLLIGAVRAWRNSYYRQRYSQPEVDETLRVLRAQGVGVEPAERVHDVADDDEDDLARARPRQAGPP